MPEQPMTKGDFAYATLREKVLSGEFAPGEVLNQATLARAIGISTTPLREALRRLKSEGLVELDAHRDARVAELTAAEAHDLLEVRRALDPLAVSLAATRRTDADITAIHAAARDLRPLRRNPGVEDLIAHRRFHSALYRASHNALLISALDGLWDKADRYRRLGLEVPRGKPERDRTTLEHRLLVEHLVAGDAEAAATVMRAHIAASLGAKAASQLDGTTRAHR
ncbi:GntR family transcriptional regulator [Umezawaea sp. Da 62-37]|uniref:GntR family transcriptional regulator n=1 Tax=Umezawaea sp. Da 62-37 TaxID=3075927 RepID=UPI0028F6F4AE|nr:GntR family transcriptional regulator [Umezawaea sp. Da 62-37]WNV88908.1 GntR family transcriptional regulator [Umezawaea sp. Da 62-37]